MDSPSNSWIHRLLKPTAYPHPTGDIRLIETHISWVILTGEYAYKIKKPMYFGFVDFSTLSLREAACHEEIRLNQRWNKALYLDVCPITGTEEQPRMGGGGQPFEFAVRMRQFEQRALLSRCVGQGRLTKGHLERFALELARFHQSVSGNPGPVLGSVEAIRDPVMHNFDPLLEGNLPGPDKRLAASLRDFSQNWIDSHQDVLTRRHDDGFVRECHGDLHLGNMLLLDDRIELFDCLEFNVALRWSDVMSEIAFLVMDLENHGEPGLARHFLNAYIEFSGDHAGLEVLPFYMTYRAVVRAKVDQLNRIQQGQSVTERIELLRELESYLLEASRYAHEAQPRLAVVSGVSGSGKTHHSSQFIESGFIRIRSDFERKRLARSPLGEPVEWRPSDSSISAEELYSAEFTERTYEELARRAELCLAAGFSVVVDATCLKADQRAVFIRLAERLGVPFRLFVLENNTSVLEERIRNRQALDDDYSDAGIEVLHRQLAEREPLSKEEIEVASTIDGLAEQNWQPAAEWLF